MSHPINDTIFEQAFEAGESNGYTKALADLTEWVCSLPPTPSNVQLIKWIEGKLGEQ